MAKVTSKLQVTIPKTLAEQLGIEPGDEIQWSLGGDSLKVRPHRGASGTDAVIPERLRMFDQATARQRRRRRRGTRAPTTTDRGWTREELYRRGGTR